jgi:hypothetical protein
MRAAHVDTACRRANAARSRRWGFEFGERLAAPSHSIDATAVRVAAPTAPRKMPFTGEGLRTNASLRCDVVHRAGERTSGTGGTETIDTSSLRGLHRRRASRVI